MSFDQQSFNNKIAATLGEHSSKLDILLTRTANLPDLATKVATHDTKIKLIETVTYLISFGFVTTFFAFLKAKFWPHA